MAKRSHCRVIDREGKQWRGRTGRRALDNSDLCTAQTHAGFDGLCLSGARNDSRECYAKWYEKRFLLHAARP
jgi:hypothetical protein